MMFFLLPIDFFAHFEKHGVGGHGGSGIVARHHTFDHEDFIARRSMINCHFFVVCPIVLEYR